MKKFWMIAFVIALVLAVGITAYVFIANKVKAQEEKMFMEALLEQATLICTEEAEKLADHPYIQVESIDFNIKKISPVLEGWRYIIYVDWFVQAEVYASTQSDRELWMTLVSHTMEKDITVNGKRISLTYMDDNYNEGCNLYYNDSAAMNGYDYFRDVTEKNDGADTGYSEVRCSRCGNSYRASSSFGLRVKKGQPCGVSGCGK